MIVLEIRCGLSKGSEQPCATLLGYVDSDLNILYPDRTVGFIISCTRKPSHHAFGEFRQPPDDDDDDDDWNFEHLFAGGKIPPDWEGVLPVKLEFIQAAEGAIASGPKKLPRNYFWPNT